MKYYKYNDDNDLIGESGIRYVEAREGVAIREVTVFSKFRIGSNIAYPGLGIVLAEGACDYDGCFPDVTPITADEFEREWASHLEADAGRWGFLKAAFEIGRSVTGRIRWFLPMGVIVDFGDGVLGVADGDECRNSFEPGYLESGHQVEVVVDGYDETFHWLVLSSPRVSENRSQ